MSIHSKVFGIVKEQINVGNVSMTSDLVDEHNADSLDMVEIIINVEQEFDVHIPDEVVETLRTVGDIVVYVDQNLSPYHPIRDEVNHVEYS
jgi:acyl carrier protein|tara:strand:- start:1713 stop:1985 length:273 start_codon:yes stop_codon:yes gene_type:complete